MVVPGARSLRGLVAEVGRADPGLREGFCGEVGVVMGLICTGLAWLELVFGDLGAVAGALVLRGDSVGWCKAQYGSWPWLLYVFGFRGLWHTSQLKQPAQSTKTRIGAHVVQMVASVDGSVHVGAQVLLSWRKS